MISRIFLDGADPQETKQVIDLLGFLDGQTTNPTLLSKNPAVANRLQEKKFTQEGLLDLYKNVVQGISALIPQGFISIQVYADSRTSTDEMLEQGKEMYNWIPNAHIKYPATFEGIKAARESVKLDMRVNMTLLFSQSQAAAIYNATMGAKKGQVIISPFVGRLDDNNQNGMSLVENIIKMFEGGDGHIQVLAASIRNINYLLYSFKLGTDIVTLPYKIIKEWKDLGMPTLADDFVYQKGNMSDIPYQKLDLTKEWTEFDLHHDLTDQGLEKFASDWNNLIANI